MPPEVLENKPYIKAADIYSFSIIMWEILFGIPVIRIYEFFNEYFGPQLGMEMALKKLRPLIPPIPESCYIYVMKILTEYDKKIWQIRNAEWQELTKYDKNLRQTRNYKINDNFSDEISLDQYPNNNTFQLNSKDESEELIIKFEEFISQSITSEDFIINFEDSRGGSKKFN
ncbi:hypothetical protein C2G38_2246416 [Gigaspora rosea]|uniref:Protein kinase domain-containing protein n=1 Tax=Gigaspora rosea TaxID=44941 RepID=A0A397VDL9_9GLOM|nr:hypothetical protein C2G38_2246416 [Gigaspora rosea]